MVPIAASCTYARALISLLQALEREQTWDPPKRLLLFPRIALAAPAPSSSVSSSTQQCRLNCMASDMDPLGELIARIQWQATTDGPRTRAQSRAVTMEMAAASPFRALLAEVAPGRAL